MTPSLKRTQYYNPSNGFSSHNDLTLVIRCDKTDNLPYTDEENKDLAKLKDFRAKKAAKKLDTGAQGWLNSHEQRLDDLVARHNARQYAAHTVNDSSNASFFCAQ